MITFNLDMSVSMIATFLRLKELCTREQLGDYSRSITAVDVCRIKSQMFQPRKLYKHLIDQGMIIAFDTIATGFEIERYFGEQA